LREKLLNQGFSEDSVRNMDRETLMHTYAETLSIPSVSDISEQSVASGRYDIDSERERLMLQKMELEEKRLAREFEMRKHADVIGIKLAELQLQSEKMS